MQELADLYPDRRVVLARELTKKFEEVRSGSPRQLLEELQKRSIHGEFVVLVGSKGL
jgi:16S rRNA (cytidine1402-2'-O)-methyltransferase